MTLYFARCLYSVGDTQPDDESESGDIFDAVDHLGQLTLKVADVCLETVCLILMERRWWLFYLNS